MSSEGKTERETERHRKDSPRGTPQPQKATDELQETLRTLATTSKPEREKREREWERMG